MKDNADDEALPSELLRGDAAASCTNAARLYAADCSLPNSSRGVAAAEDERDEVDRADDGAAPQSSSDRDSGVDGDNGRMEGGDNGRACE